ncbi:MAG: hypothetical protein DSY43_06010 [Gammaproteobacteria bacterium]|nr:MAG: hypothetical protein DSY43_06010 [Gammaproteobacteria bacterium]
MLGYKVLGYQARLVAAITAAMLFCTKCGTLIEEIFAFCRKCGVQIVRDQNLQSSAASGSTSNGEKKENPMGFKEFHSKKERERASFFRSKGKRNRPSENLEETVKISIGIMLYDGYELRKQRGKNLMVNIKKAATKEDILKMSIDKHSAHSSDLINARLKYTLLYDDGSEVEKLKESSDDFVLYKYKGECGKPYHRITLFLCEAVDLAKSSLAKCLDSDPNESDMDDSDVEQKGTKKGKLSRIVVDVSDEKASDSSHCPSYSGVQCNSKVDSPQVTLMKETTGIAGPSGISTSNLHANNNKNVQIQHDEDLARSLQNEMDKELGENLQDDILDEANLLRILQKRVITLSDGANSLFIVLRRGAPLERVLTLWRRVSSKISPKNELRVKYVGEDGIDSGAISKEFLTTTLPDIGKHYFPDGSPKYSTNAIQNGSFRACGEIVAVSLAQGGPPPCFLSSTVYNTLVMDKDIDFTNVTSEEHLTPHEQQLLQNIKTNVLSYQEVIIDHGYTGVIDEAHLDSIMDSIVVSILSKRIVCLKEFKRGLNLYGLSDIITNSPQIAKGLFVMGEQKEVDANYLFSLIQPEYSPEGTSRRQTEEAVMDFFQDFIFELEDEKVCGYTEATAWDDDCDLQENSQEDMFSSPDLTVAGVLGWLTGQKHRGDISIYAKFDHECLERNPGHKVCFPTVGACGRTITIPVNHMDSKEKFKDIFLLAFCKGQAFALA